MPNWCANTFIIKDEPEAIRAFLPFVNGELIPFYQKAIDLSIKVYCLGAIGYYKPICNLNIPCPDLLKHGLGEINNKNVLYSFFVGTFFVEDMDLSETSCQTIVKLCNMLIPATDDFIDTLSEDQKNALTELLQKKRFDWTYTPKESTLKETWRALEDDSYSCPPLDFQFVYPPDLLPEINGFNGDLLPRYVKDGYAASVERYGIKWARGYHHTVTRKTDNQLIVSFDTPWSPVNDETVKRMVERFRLKFVEHYFSESGLGFCGYRFWVDQRLADYADDELEFQQSDENEDEREVISPRYIIDKISHFTF